MEDINYTKVLYLNMLITAWNKLIKINALRDLQDLNGNLVINHIDFQTRKIMIETICKAKYMDLRVRFVSEFNKELNKIHN